ncbi:MAG TPA: asparaginase [Gemmatimonadales bacterium]|nr:asparaginase [Gemmatimonadales bacterium]
MTAPAFRVEATRGPLVESTHRVAVAVVRADGRLLASAGDSDQVAWWRSAAKPFQAMPLLEDGVDKRFGLESAELALACASHSSEPAHLEGVDRFMAKAGVKEEDLACGLHPPISAEVAKTVLCGTATMTPKWSNCSGKHTGMLALARHHGWPLAGYHAEGHPVQARILEVVTRWTGAPRAGIQTAPDGCTAVCFALPLRNMALAYARLGAATEGAAFGVARAMMKHPLLVAGTGRLCTDLMTEWPGNVIAKVGADGIYCAALRWVNLGIALKVEDGDTRAAPVALLEVMRQVLERPPTASAGFYSLDRLAGHARQPIVNTRGVTTGELRPAGSLRFSDD